MPSDSRFSRLPDGAGAPVTIYFDEQPLEARAGDSVAAALLAAGLATTRTPPVSGACRGPFCMMGACFDCLVEIDGEPNRQGWDEWFGYLNQRRAHSYYPEFLWHNTDRVDLHLHLRADQRAHLE